MHLKQGILGILALVLVQASFVSSERMFSIRVNSFLANEFAVNVYVLLIAEI